MLRMLPALRCSVVATAGWLLLANQGVAVRAATGYVYTWPDESAPSFPNAQCTGTVTYLAGVSDYTTARAACEADGIEACAGVLYLSVAGFWYKCDNIAIATASTFRGFIPSLEVALRASNPSLYRAWGPQPQSSLGSTANIETTQHAACEGKYRGYSCEEKVCAFGLSSSASPFLGDAAASEAHEADNLWTPGSNYFTSDAYNGRLRTLADGGVHSYAECSSRGVCDRATGVCQCFAGYGGKGCRRTQCSNDCSGHGVCQRNVDVNEAYTVAEAPLARFSSQYWDGLSTMRCACDRGYEGPDCSQRICPHGDDVLTTCAADSNYDVQVISFTDADGDWAAQQAADGAPLFYTLSFEDHFGGQYTTRPIVLTEQAERNARDAQAALEALPNSAVPTVQVGADVTAAITVSVSFVDPATTGKQNTLVVSVLPSTLTCTEGGHTPLYHNTNATDSVTVAVAHQPLADDASSYEENVPCGNRGICDDSTGKCACFDGHTGEACQIQSVYV